MVYGQAALRQRGDMNRRDDAPGYRRTQGEGVEHAAAVYIADIRRGTGYLAWGVDSLYGAAYIHSFSGRARRDFRGARSRTNFPLYHGQVKSSI